MISSMMRWMVVMTMLDQNFVVLNSVLLPSIRDVAKLVLRIDLANSVIAFHLGSNNIKRLAIRCLSSLDSILGQIPIGSWLPGESWPFSQHLVSLLGMLNST